VGRLPVRYQADVADTQLGTRGTQVLPVLGTRYTCFGTVYSGLVPSTLACFFRVRLVRPAFAALCHSMHALFCHRTLGKQHQSYPVYSRRYDGADKSSRYIASNSLETRVCRSQVVNAYGGPWHIGSTYDVPTTEARSYQLPNTVSATILSSLHPERAYIETRLYRLPHVPCSRSHTGPIARIPKTLSPEYYSYSPYRHKVRSTVCPADCPRTATPSRAVNYHGHI
jgi:hypothetical protein